MINKLEHLYIHIPFCKNICTYCDFVRKIENNSNVIDEYIKHIINEINTIVYPLKTIYIGGGTPNSLNIKQLSLLLKHVQVKLAKNYEFTIELNPEFVTKEQVMVLKSYGVNRASIGVQTTNDSILHQFNRQHSFKDVLTAITKLQKVGISNISLDLLYGFNELNLNDINKAISVIKKNNIKHVSWYALEIKENSMLARDKYVCNDDLIDEQLQLIISEMKKNGFNRYEVSNWSTNKRYESMHNKAYWLTKDWRAIGYGGCGLENKIYYQNVGSANKWHRQETKYNLHDYYQHILIMGLRLKIGLNLSHGIYKKAYIHFKDKLTNTHIFKNHLICDNLNLLNLSLENLV